MVIVVTSLASSIYSLVSSLQSQDLTLPPPPLWLDATPLVGKKLTETWMLVATNLPAVLDTIRPLVEAAPRHGWRRSLVVWPSANYRSFFHLRLPPCSSPIGRAPPTLRDACSRV